MLTVYVILGIFALVGIIYGINWAVARSEDRRRIDRANRRRIRRAIGRHSRKDGDK